MTKLNYVFIIAIALVLLGAILIDAYGHSVTSMVLIVGGGCIAVFSGIASFYVKKIKNK